MAAIRSSPTLSNVHIRALCIQSNGAERYVRIRARAQEKPSPTAPGAPDSLHNGTDGGVTDRGRSPAARNPWADPSSPARHCVGGFGCVLTVGPHRVSSRVDAGIVSAERVGMDSMMERGRRGQRLGSAAIVVRLGRGVALAGVDREDAGDVRDYVIVTREDDGAVLLVARAGADTWDRLWAVLESFRTDDE